MKENISVKPDKTRLISLLEDINDGNLRVPVFQRDFVWKPNQLIELFDSIVKGYPIGSLLFWKPTSSFKTKDKIGPYIIPTNSKDVSYVLDGFQRITTLFSVLSNPKKMGVEENSKEFRKYLIYYNLKEKEFTYLRNKKDKKSYLIPLYKIIDTFEYLDFFREIENDNNDDDEVTELIENAKKLSKIFYEYEIPYVEIKGGDIKSAVEIFSRINSTGVDISEDFMLSALTYNQNNGFLFSVSITDFLNKLSVYNFDDLKRDTILNCIANTRGKIYFDVKMEELLKPESDLEIVSQKSFDHIEKAVHFLFTRVNVINTKLLPYPTQLIFISEYFRNKINPTEADLVKLEEWFWITSYSNYFTIYSLSQQRNAYKYFMEFIKGQNENGIYKVSVDESFTTVGFPSKLNFSNVRSKVLQLFYLKQIRSSDNSDSTIKEQFIYNEKDRSPGNIIFRLSSEYEKKEIMKDVSLFIKESDLGVLKKHFIDENISNLYSILNADSFIKARQELIKKAERTFVSELGISYYDEIEEEF